MSFSGMLFFMLLGLVVFGPKKSIEMGTQLGRALAGFKRARSHFQTQLKAAVQDSDAAEIENQ